MSKPEIGGLVGRPGWDGKVTQFQGLVAIGISRAEIVKDFMEELQ